MEVTINYQYESMPKGQIKCKSNETVKSICKEIARRLKVELNSINFILEGTGITSKDFNQNIGKYVTDLNKGIIELLVSDRDNSEFELINNQELHVLFAYKYEFFKIRCESDDQIFDICQKLCVKVGENINYLNFYYRNQKLDLYQNFDEVVSAKDFRRKEIQIYVEKNNKKIIEKNDEKNKICSFIKKNMIAIIIIVGLCIIFAIILIAIILKNNNNKNKQKTNEKPAETIKTNNIQKQNDSLNDIINSTEKITIENSLQINSDIVENQTEKIVETTEMTEIEEEEVEFIIENKCEIKCLKCNMTSSPEECTYCEKGFELYNGLCIKYTFSATYHVEYYSELIQLFNPKKTKSIYAMKVNDALINPVAEYKLNKVEKDIVYFYFLENYPISLSYFFEGITKLIDFSFNKDSINNYNNFYINIFNITNMKGMFSGCTSLTSIIFDQFNGHNVIDISYLFYGCDSLKSIDMKNFNSTNLIKMNNCFHGCKSLTIIILSNNIKTNKVTDMSYLFYNCSLLQSVPVSNFNTQNFLIFQKCFIIALH